MQGNTSEMMQWVRYSNSLGFTFNGRARRREYWWNFLFYNLVYMGVGVCATLLSFILSFISNSEIIIWLLSIVCSLVYLTILAKLIPISVRRLHDTGKSGWFYLICILLSCCCGIGSILLIYFMVSDSTPGDNQYGPNPKGVNGMNQDMYNGQNNMYGQPNMNNMNNMNNMYGQNNMNNQANMNNGYNQGNMYNQQGTGNYHNQNRNQ